MWNRLPVPDKSEVEGRPTRGHIVVVDDYADTRAMYAECFVRAGFHVVEASDGAEALAAIVASRPDCVVMDLAMPGMDGWEATRRLKADPATASIPVVIVTGTAVVAELDRAQLLGAQAICIKPMLPADLLSCVERILG